MLQIKSYYVMEEKVPYLKKVKEHVTEVVDKETGEILETTIKTDKIVVTSSESFFYTYARILGIYSELGGIEIKTLTWLIINASTNSNRVIITKRIKELIAESMKISISAVNNSIPILCNKGILIKENKDIKKRDASYLINPLYFWRGDRGSRNKSLKYMFELTLEENLNSINE